MQDAVWKEPLKFKVKTCALFFPYAFASTSVSLMFASSACAQLVTYASLHNLSDRAPHSARPKGDLIIGCAGSVPGGHFYIPRSQANFQTVVVLTKLGKNVCAAFSILSNTRLWTLIRL